MYFKCWMSFAPWFKVFRDTDVDLLRPTGEPNTAARAQLFGFLHLFKSKDVFYYFVSPGSSIIPRTTESLIISKQEDWPLLC